MNTKQNAIAKIKETSVAAAIITLIIFIFVVLSFVLTAISGIKMAMDENFFTMAVQQDGSVELVTCIPAIAECLKKEIELILLAVIMFSASKMFWQISADGTPFRMECAKHMKRIALILLFHAILPNLVQCLIVGFAVSWRDSGFSLGLGSLFLGMIFIMLAQIFSYGCMLQKESDDTI